MIMKIDDLRSDYVYSLTDPEGKETFGIFKYLGQTGKPIFGNVKQEKTLNEVFCIFNWDTLVVKEMGLATESDRWK